MKPLISVIIPTYNHEKYIQETVESIVNQTYQNIELLCIDDGSKDLSFQILKILQKKYASRFVRFHIQTQENVGMCETMNRLIALCKGEYVYLIASDDKARPQCLELEEAFLSENPDYVLCVGNNEFINSKSEQCYITKDFTPVATVQEADFRNFVAFLEYHNKFSFQSDQFGRYDRLFNGNFIPNGYLIRREAYDKIGSFKKEAPLEDWWQMLQLSKYWKFKYINRILFSYRMHDTNTSWNREKMLMMTKKTFEYEKKHLLTIPDEELRKEALLVKRMVLDYNKKHNISN